MSTSSRRHHSDPGRRPDRHTRPHPAASPSHLSELGTEVVATRLRTLGHPLRLRILGALDGRAASADDLAEQFGETAGAVRAHLAVLYRAGVVRADWPSLWLVDQLAYRLRLRALDESAADEQTEESPACR
jgi:DNA-binding transcriptional ArsR family regulator